MHNSVQEIEQNKGWPSSIWKKDDFKAREVNDRLMMAERGFTDQDGLFGRSWYKHLVRSFNTSYFYSSNLILIINVSHDR